MSALTPAVSAAVDAIRNHFAGKPVEVVADGAGGAYLTIDGVDVGASFTSSTTWLGFQINAAYPHSDVYPHYIGRLGRLGGAQQTSAIQSVMWRGRAALQVSRRSNRWNSQVDNAALKAEKVLSWLRSL